MDFVPLLCDVDHTLLSVGHIGQNAQFVCCSDIFVGDGHWRTIQHISEGFNLTDVGLTVPLWEGVMDHWSCQSIYCAQARRRCCTILRLNLTFSSKSTNALIVAISAVTVCINHNNAAIIILHSDENVVNIVDACVLWSQLRGESKQFNWVLSSYESCHVEVVDQAVQVHTAGNLDKVTWWQWVVSRSNLDHMWVSNNSIGNCLLNTLMRLIESSVKTNKKW